MHNHNSLRQNVSSTDSPSPMTRRDALRTMTVHSAAVGAGVLGMSTMNLNASAADVDGNYIDAHSHIWTAETDKFPLANGQTKADLKPPSFTDDELMKLAGPEGVKRAVLIQHHIYHGWDNSYLVDAAKRHPDRFRVVGMIDDTKPNPDAEMRRLRPQHVTGIRITSLIRGADKWLDGPGMAAMWKCGAEIRTAMCCLVNPDDLPRVDAMCHQFPDTPVVIDHFARIGMDGTIQRKDLDLLCGLAKHRYTSVKISAYYALGEKKPPHLELVPMIRRLYESFGARRLMWASDSPYQLTPPNTYHDSIALIRDKLDFVTKEERDWLLRGTAESVFFS